MSYQQVTPIEMLPELEDLERGNSRGGPPNYNSATQGSSPYTTNANYLGQTMIPAAEAERIGRFIRDGHSAPTEAGMEPYNEAPPPLMSQNNLDQNMVNSKNAVEVPNNDNYKSFNMPNNSPSCLDVAEHIANCPICSKLYNNDKTIYIVAIIVLAILCLILLKRVLNC